MKTGANRTVMVRFIFVFFLLVIGLTWLIKLPFIDKWIISPYVEGITSISGFIYGIIDNSVEASRTYLRHPDFSVNIKKGCDGIVATIILVSACLAFPSSWGMKIKGIVTGYLLIFFLNIMRILVLFSLGVQGHMDIFNLVHEYVAQFIVIVGAMVFWIYWAGKTRTVSADYRLLLFAAFFCLLLPAALALHWILSPLTDLIITLGAKVFYSISGSDTACSIRDRTFLFKSARPSFEAAVSLQDITVNQPLLWTLIAVSPGIRILNRLKKLLLGTGILLASHLLFLLCKVELTLIEAGHPMAGSPVFWSSLDNFMEITGKGFFPVAIWLALTFNYLLGEMDRRDKTNTKQVGRNDPCPCGSGEKFKNCCMP